VVVLKYGVVICPACGRARGLQTSRKTSTCPCGRQVKLRRASFRFLTDSPRELADMVAQANEQLANGKQVRRKRARSPKDPFARIAQSAALAKDPVGRAEIVARELTRELGEFGVEDVRRVLKIIGKGSAEDMVDKLLGASIVYEAGEGRFRSV
jgi:uncharacterized Zn finger protein (UPF0148 family)